MITITNSPNKVRIDSTTSAYMTSIIMKQAIIQVSLNAVSDYVVIYTNNGNDKYIISYIYLDPTQRTELNINNNQDLFNYFDSIL
jgi:hypothetical protein